VPFFTIPINHVSEDGEVLPLLNVNPKGLSIAGVVTAILTLAVPLLSKPGPGMQYRSTSFIPISSLYLALKQQIFYKYSRIIWWISVSGLDSQWSQMGDTINEIVFSNRYITPCVQRIVCTIVSEASHSDNPTSTDKIIDGLSRYG